MSQAYKSPFNRTEFDDLKGVSLTEQENRELEDTIAKYVNRLNEATRRLVEHQPEQAAPIVPELSDHPTEEEKEKHRIAVISLTAWEESAPEAWKQAKADLDKARSDLSAAITSFTTKIKTAPSISTHFPSQHIASIDRISKAAFGGELAPIQQELDLKAPGNGFTVAQNARSKKPITTYASLNFDDLGDRVKTATLTEYDRAVYNAIVTLYIEGQNEWITTRMIYQTLTGDPKARITKLHTQLINASIDRLMSGLVRINAEEEAIGKNAGMKTSFKANLILAEGVTAIMQGERVDCIHILKPPVLYTYASQKKQISRVDVRLLQTGVNKNPDNIVLTHYLLSRIDEMKHSNISRKIRYQAIFDKLGIAGSSKTITQKKWRIRGEYLPSILNDWKTAGFISDFTAYRNAGSKTDDGIEIILTPLIKNPQRGE